jgi:hypothetical protein
MIPLILDSNILFELRMLVKYAEEHPFSMDDLLDMYNKAIPNTGERKEHVVHIPFGYTVVYGIENQVPGSIRHMSMSLNQEYRVPSPEAVQIIMVALGFKSKLDDCKVYMEDVCPHIQAINVIEFIK